MSAPFESLACFDADGTLFDGWSVVPVAGYFADHGLIEPEERDFVHEPFLQYAAGHIGYKDFVTGSLESMAAVLDGASLDDAEQLSTDYFQNGGVEWFDYVDPTLAAMESGRVGTVLVTAEPQFIATGIKKALGFDYMTSSVFNTDDQGRFNGEIGLVLGSAAKATAIEEIRGELPIRFAYGDSDGDIGMLELAEEDAVCIKPTPELAAHGRAQGWSIIEDPDIATSLV